MLDSTNVAKNSGCISQIQVQSWTLLQDTIIVTFWNREWKPETTAEHLHTLPLYRRNPSRFIKLCTRTDNHSTLLKVFTIK